MAGAGRSTLRALGLAWAVVAAILALAWLFKPEAEEAPRGQVRASYEVQAPRAPVELAPVDARAAVAEVASAAPAEVDSSSPGAEVAEIDSRHAPRVGTGRIFGTVTVRETGEPFAGLRVHVMTWGRSPYWSYNEVATVTSADGGYAFEALPDGDFEVAPGTGRYENVAGAEGTGDCVAEDSADVRLEVGEARRVDFQVSRAGRVWGKVTDLRGQPVRRAKIFVGTTESIVTQMATIAASGRRPLISETDARGDYVVHGVPFEQEWQVWFDEDDHSPVLSPSFVLHPTRPQVRMDVSLLDGSRVSGRVVDAQGRPIGNAEVISVPRYTALLSPMRRAQTARKTRTGTDGLFTLTGLPPGDYQVMAFHDDYRVALKGTPIYPDGRSDIAGVEVVLHRLGGEGSHVLEGTVVGADGAPIDSANVGLGAVGMESLSFAGQETHTGKDGAFRFEGLGDETFILTAAHQGYRPRVVEDLKLDRPLRVELERVASLSGTVVANDGAAPARFSVRVVRVTGTDADASLLANFDSHERTFEGTGGRFDIPDAPPGLVLLEATAPDLPPGRVEVEVPRAQATSGVTIRLPAVGASIRGRVTLAGGVPVPGAKVTVVEVGGARGVFALASRQRRAGGPPQVTTDARGEFVITNLAAASYDLGATHVAHAPGALRAVATRVGEATDVTLVLGSGGTITGKAAPGVMITVAGDAYSAMTSAAADGAFRLERVPPGEVLVRAVNEDLTRTADVRRLRVQVVEGRETVVDFVDEVRGRTVSGRVEAPMHEGGIVMVLLRVPGSPPPDPADLVFQGQLGVRDPEASRYVVAEGVAQHEGRWQLQDVPPGKYTLDVYQQSLFGTVAGGKAELLERKDLVVD